MKEDTKKILISIGIILAVVAAVIAMVVIMNKNKSDADFLLTEEAIEEVTEVVAATPEDATEEKTEGAFPEGETVLKLDEMGDNRYTLSWEERKADGYTVRCRRYQDIDNDELDNSDSSSDQDGWIELSELSSEETEFVTSRLDSYTKYDFSVVVRDGKEAYESEAIQVTTGATTLYTTIWTTRDMAFFSDSDGDEQLGTVPVLTALSVLGEKNGRFLVQYEDSEGYVNSNYCMINLPDYIGGLCRYDITNSYSSIYLAHEYAIPGVSGTVISGYENVLLSDGTFLVPLLYPVAKKACSCCRKCQREWLCH